MRNIRSLIEDNNATGMCAFVFIGGLSSVLLFVEGQILNVLTLCPCSLPAWSSLIGGSIGKIWGIAHTWVANILTA